VSPDNRMFLPTFNMNYFNVFSLRPYAYECVLKYFNYNKKIVLIINTDGKKIESIDALIEMDAMQEFRILKKVA
jgi:hypothetical protein